MKAELAGGDPNAQPKSRNHKFVEGRRGKALEMKQGQDCALCYLTKGNLNLKRGTVAFWFKPDKAAQAGDASARRYFLCTQTASPRAGSGTLWFWKYGVRLRADQSDDADQYVMSSRPMLEDAWNHLAFTWGEDGVCIYLNGRSSSTPTDSSSLLAAAIKNKGQDGGLTFSRRRNFDKFFVGGYGGRGYACVAVNCVRQVERPGLGVVVVRQFSGNVFHFHVMYAEVIQHLAGHVGSGHPSRGGNLGILVEP